MVVFPFAVGSKSSGVCVAASMIVVFGSGCRRSLRTRKGRDHDAEECEGKESHFSPGRESSLVPLVFKHFAIFHGEAGGDQMVPWNHGQVPFKVSSLLQFNIGP